MDRIVIEKPHVVGIGRTAKPKAGPGTFIIRTIITGISAGTEMSLYRGTHPNLKSGKWGYWNEYPILPGYELVGEVEEVGSGVDDLVKGDRVVSLSPHAAYALVSPGTMESVPALYHKIPPGVTDEKALFSVLGTTTMHAVHRAKVEYGECVVVVGLGVVGMLGMMQARLAGAGIVIGIDINQSRLAMADDLGADLVLDGHGAHLSGQIFSLSPNGADLVIEATGTPAGLETALLLAGDRARVVVLGFHTETVPLCFGDEIYHKELTIIASRAVGPDSAGLPHSYVPWTAGANLDRVLELMRQGRFQPEKMITHRRSYKDIAEIYRMIDEGREDFLQIVLEW
ncbi:zinc-binding dehydrogenase [candidate division KSB1 bacterium]